MFDCYPVIITGDRTQAGDRQLGDPITLPTSLSRMGNFSLLREKRRRAASGHCGINSDSAQQIIDHAVTGNDSPTTSHWPYRIGMSYAIYAYHRLNRGGLAARNWLSSGRKSEGWAAPKTGTQPPPQSEDFDGGGREVIRQSESWATRLWGIASHPMTQWAKVSSAQKLWGSGLHQRHGI